MFLRHLRHHKTAIGKVSAIFARDKYQGKAGNLSHNHLIMALDKKSETEKDEGSEGDDKTELQDLIRTSTLEIVHGPDDLATLLKKDCSF